jgi:hypothetical protein
VEKRLARRKFGQELPGLDRLLVQARVMGAPNPDNGRIGNFSIMQGMYISELQR